MSAIAIFRQLPREAGSNGTEARSRRLHSGGKKSEPLVSAGTSDALVHQELDIGPAIFSSPGSTLVGGGGVALTHCARRGNAANWNTTVLKQIGDHCLSALLAQHLIAGSGAHR